MGKRADLTRLGEWEKRSGVMRLRAFLWLSRFRSLGNPQDVRVRGNLLKSAEIPEEDFRVFEAEYETFMKGREYGIRGRGRTKRKEKGEKKRKRKGVGPSIRVRRLTGARWIDALAPWQGQCDWSIRGQGSGQRRTACSASFFARASTCSKRKSGTSTGKDFVKVSADAL